MKKLLLLFVSLLLFSCGDSDSDSDSDENSPTPAVYLAANGVTIKAYDLAVVGCNWFMEY